MRKWIRWPVRLLAAIGFICLVVTFTPLVSWWASALAGPWWDSKGETLVVLSGSNLDSDIIGDSSYWRSVYAVLVYREGGVRRIILSGGGGAIKPIAELMRGVLETSGVPSEVIEVESKAQSTRESVLLLKPILQKLDGRAVLLTSDYHVFRASRAFQKENVPLLPRPIPDALKRAARWQKRWGVFLELVSETTKIGYYAARGWI